MHMGRALQQGPAGRPPAHARAVGLRRQLALTEPRYLPPDGTIVPVDWEVYSADPITLAALIGDPGESIIQIDSSADFEWVMLQNGPAAPCLVHLKLIGGPFSGIELTPRPIDSRLIFGTGARPGFIPLGGMLPKNTQLRLHFTNLTATAQTFTPVLVGRAIFTPEGQSLANLAPGRLPYWHGYDFLPLAAAAVEITLGTSSILNMTSGDFQIVAHNVTTAAVDGAATLATGLDLNFRDRGQLQRLLFQGMTPSEAIRGDGTEPFYLPVRRFILAGQRFEVRASDTQAVAAAQFVRGMLSGIFHLGGYQPGADDVEG